jgi:hypothetical protein
VDDTHSVYVAGYYASASLTIGTCTATNAASGTNDFFAFELSSSGSCLWSTSIGGSGAESGSRVVVDSQSTSTYYGSVYSAGSFTSSTLTVGGKTLTNAGSTDIWAGRIVSPARRRRLADVSSGQHLPLKAAAATPDRRALSSSSGVVSVLVPYNFDTLPLAANGYTSYVVDTTTTEPVLYPAAYLRDSFSTVTMATAAPTTTPSSHPTKPPTGSPTAGPTIPPSKAPTLSPTSPTTRPTIAATVGPTTSPSTVPTVPPSIPPSSHPTQRPSRLPTVGPTRPPSKVPTIAPTAPIVQPTVAPTQAPTPTPYPEVKDLQVVGRRSTAVSASITLSKAGTAYCYAGTSLSAPTGALAKERYCGVVAVARGYAAFNVTCSGLVPLTRYYLFVYTEDTSTPANRLPDTLVAASRSNVRRPPHARGIAHETCGISTRFLLGKKHHALTSLVDIKFGSLVPLCLRKSEGPAVVCAQVTTACCYTVTLPALPTTLYAGTVSPALSASVPVVGAAVRIITQAFIPAKSAAACNTSLFATAGPSAFNSSLNVTVSPRATLSFASATSAAFALLARREGCYRVSYVLSGGFPAPAPRRSLAR